MDSGGTTERAPRRRWRPPDVSLSAEVYERLHQIAVDERRQLHTRGRPFGTIVMDALERHAERLAQAWTTQPANSSPLFVRPASTAVPKRRRHVQPPRTVPLSGIDATNTELLDKLAAEWGAVTRSALVEQALLFEFEWLDTGDADERSEP